jgi:hypothetical protein
MTNQSTADNTAIVGKRIMAMYRLPARQKRSQPLRPLLLGVVSLCLQIGCDESSSSKISIPFGGGNDPRDLTYAEWKKETEAGRGDSLARQLTPDEIEAISAGILSHKGDSAAVAVLTMRELIELGRNVKKGGATIGTGRTQ